MLYRPVGLSELALVWRAEMRAFPPRLPEQPIFYPVTTLDYAEEIARDWNANSPPGYAGYVTRFAVRDSFLAGYERHIVGARRHAEYWIPAGELENFNAAIEGEIEVVDAFFGAGFKGLIPSKFGLRGKDASEQFVYLSRVLDYSGQDFSGETWANREAIFLHFLYWMSGDFSRFGIDAARRDTVLDRIRWSWEYHQLKPRLPAPEDRSS